MPPGASEAEQAVTAGISTIPSSRLSNACIIFHPLLIAVLVIRINAENHETPFALSFPLPKSLPMDLFSTRGEVGIQ